jgi:2-furoyl-CoA dehydrogenase 2Fe-2S iron sulfur subunit
VLNILQEAFKKHHALQCGFCTAGILMSATQYLAENPDPTEDAVKEMLSGHICRCTGYYPIVAAILDAARAIRSTPRAAKHITKEKP